MGLRWGWKPIFYGQLLPRLQGLSARRSGDVLRTLGEAHLLWPPRRARIRTAVEGLRRHLAAMEWDAEKVSRAVAGGLARYAGRDYLLDGLDPAALDRRFRVEGVELLRELHRERRGVILVGCHLGGHLSAVHWLLRKGFPIRMLVQRPRHVSRALGREFDRDDPGYPQSGFFVRRDLPPQEAAARLVRAWKALREGYVMYLNSDVPWEIATARRARFLGREMPLLSLWADLAAITRAPVVRVFCTHEADGVYRIRFEGPIHVSPGGEQTALEEYLGRLEAMIREHPGDAIPYFLWPHFEEAASRGPGAPDRQGSTDHEAVRRRSA
jgi:lauroyl/myristoyl acyltransferase